jgi:hypothetical protein
MDGRSRQSNSPRRGGRWEPKVADLLLKRMMATAPNVRVFYNSRAVRVLKQGHRVTGVVAVDATGAERTLLGAVVIDATHEGDIAAWAGVPYRVGREARSPLEPHAGQIRFFNPTGEIMEGSTGVQDRAVVSYGLRLTIQNYPKNSGTSHILASPPPDYNAADYALAHYTGTPTMPNGKAELNVNPVGSEMQLVNWNWPEANYAERKRLYAVYKNHALGYLYYLQHEKQLTHLGLPKDEFTDNGFVPYRVFVREARRIQGEATMTEADINPFLHGHGLIPPRQASSIAIGHYPIDSKAVLPKTDAAKPDKGEGDFFVVDGSVAFQVPYGAIVPKDIDGLLVPVAMSATHVAFSAVRMDPTWMVMGQAAGIAAVLSLRSGVEPRHVDVAAVQRELIRQKCRLMFYWDLPIEHPAFGAIQWLSARKTVTGYEDRTFRPDQPITRGELAALVVEAFGIWPSVTNQHFDDVTYRHWAFREIETLFDHRLLSGFGVYPRWPEDGPYDPTRFSGFPRGKTRGEFHPDSAVTWKELIATVRAAQSLPASTEPDSDWAKRILSSSEFGRTLDGRTVPPDQTASRGDACILIASQSTPESAPR